MIKNVQDITERKKAENMLRNLADISDRTGMEYFQSIAAFIAGELGTEYAIIGILIANRNKVKTIAAYAHGEFIEDIEYDLRGTPCDNVMGKQACFYTDNIKELFPEDKLLVDMKAESYAGIPLFASDGHPLGIIATLGCKPMKTAERERCISLLQIFSGRVSSELERREAEEELKQKAAFVMNNPAPVLHVNKKGNVTYCNPSALEVFRTDPTGKKYPDLFPALSSFDLNEVRPDSPKQFDDKVGDQAFLFTIKKDRITDSYYIFGTNITEHKELESKLLHAQKMESIGTLAGGVAHDFNNIITAIIGFVSVLNRRMPEDDPLLVYVNQIQKAAENAANLTSSLLTFGRKQKINPVVLDFNEVIRKMGKFLLRIIGEDVEFRTILSDYQLHVRVDFNQMEQVLMNLAANARDAMPGGGILTVSTEITEIDSTFIRSHGYGDPGTYAVIAISDTGTGIDEKTKEKIFEPFFTTKEVNKGTGLGLSIVYGIIKQHDGYISVHSKPGKGTQFRIYLPMVKKSRDVTYEKQPAEPLLLTGTETILLAEDDAMIRGIIESELAEFGYTVITAEDGEDAVNKFREHGHAVQLFITDVVMPRQSGKKAYEEIKKVRPGIKVLFLSGYSEELMNELDDTDSCTALMSKPVKSEKLLQKIREILDRKE